MSSLDISREDSYMPPELVDHVLAEAASEWHSEKTFSSCSLVSHAWLTLTRRHRYKRLEFTLKHPSERRTAEIHAIMSHTRAKIPRLPLFEALQEHPLICPYVRFLDLRISQDLERAWASSNDAPSGISVLWLHKVLQLLPGLKELRLPMVIYDYYEIFALPLPVVPHLDLLEIKQPSFAADAEVWEEDFRDVLNLFGSITLLTLSGPKVVSIPDDDLPPTPAAPLVSTKIGSLTVHEHSPTSAGVLRTIANLPDAGLMTNLNLTYVLPGEILHLVQLVTTCSANLCVLALQLEPSWGTEHPLQSPSHYLPLNLSQCVKLHTLSLKIQFYMPDGWERTANPMHECRTDAKVVALIREFLSRPIPNLNCLDVKLCGGRNVLGLEMVGFDEIERLLLQFYGNGEKARRLAMTSWWASEMPSNDWDLISQLFPKLIKRGILERSL